MVINENINNVPGKKIVNIRHNSTGGVRSRHTQVLGIDKDIFILLVSVCPVFNDLPMAAVVTVLHSERIENLFIQEFRVGHP